MSNKWDFLDSLESLSEDLKSEGELAARIFKELKKERDELRECLRWYVENDDTNQSEDNKSWLDGKRRAMIVLGMEVDDDNLSSKDGNQGL